MPLKHSLNSAIPDNPVAAAAGKVVTSEWNKDHVLTGVPTNAVLFSDIDSVAGDATFTFDKATKLLNVTAAAAKGYTQTTYIANVTGSVVIDFVNGQSQILTLTGAINITAINNVPVGSILRLVLIATNYAITWPGTIAWPLATIPDLAAGSLDKGLVVLENDGAKLLATSAAY